MPTAPKPPLISVITVTFNAAPVIGRTMESVNAQTFADYEHVIVDGASADGTVALIDRLAGPRTRVVSEPDRGLYDAMNKGLGLAKGEYVIFLNAGDTFAGADTLARYAAAAEEGGSPDVVYGQTVLVDNDGNVLGDRHLTAPTNLDVESFKQGMVVCHQAFMARRAIAPPYNLHFRFSADYEWCIVCLRNARSTAYLGDEPVVHYLSEGMTTKNHRASLKERFEIMCRYFGTWPTVMRHVGFAFRFLKRRRKSVNNQ